MTNACVAIGIAQTDKLAPLPGAVNGAKSVAHWAKACGYDVELVTDEEAPVDITRVRSALLKLLPSPRDGDDYGGPVNPPDRLIVYFAGHGMQSNGSEMWLLSRSYHDQVAIGTGQIQDALAAYGTPQVAIIVDACRSPAVRDWNYAINPMGVLPLGPLDALEQIIDTDLFQAVPKFKQAYMLRARNGAPARCIFTSVLLEALHGNSADAFNARDEITSDTLVKYLRNNVKRRAGKYRVRMVPQARASWLEPTNIYVTRDRLAKLNLEPLEPWPASAKPVEQDSCDEVMGIADDSDKGIQPRASTRRRTSRKKDNSLDEFMRAVIREKEQIAANVKETKNRAEQFTDRLRGDERPNSFEVGSGVSVSGADVVDVYAGSGIESVLQVDDRGWAIALDPTVAGGFSDECWTLSELVDGRFIGGFLMSGFVADHVVDTDGCIAMILRKNGIGRTGIKNGSEQAIKDMLAGGLDPEKAIDKALVLRHEKHSDPVVGVIAAYLYHAIGDIRSIRRMAAFYHQNGQPVPYDIALLARVAVDRKGGRLIAHIPKVAKQKPRTEYEAKYADYFSESEAKDIPVAGRFPIMRTGWFALANREDALAPRELREMLGELAPAPFTTFTADGGHNLLNFLKRD